ncbi:MAG: hypothetical protein LBR19_08290, partial [Bifidobacteriaceae bacterium]|nr:hypothetical protein [Bifidobacteriaceae bacterium]
ANQANQATKPTKTPKQPKQPKPPKTAKASKRRGTLARGGLAVWVVAIIAIVCLGAGFALRGLIRSPAEAEADAAPPAAGLITARVEARQITSTVVSRADVVYADPVAVNPPIPDGAQAPVVTGHVPEEGAEITAGTILLEVSGRPVFVLPGEFPAYRSLGPDSQGPDVAQLRAALAGLGYAAGTEGATEYDADLAAAVAALYTEAGYPPPGSDDQAKNQAVRDAAAAVEDAKDARDRAWTALSKARAAISAEDPSTQAAADAAQESYQEADKQVTRAEETLTAATRAAWTTAPYGEMVFVSGLPRRVDEVNVTLGQTVGTPSADQPLDAVADDAVVLSGAEITVTAQVSAGEAALLVVGGPAVLLAHTGLSVNGTIDSICDYAALENGSGDAATTRCPVGITLGDLGEVNRSDLVGNVQVTMVVGVSAAGSLVVPVAAVSANSAGQAQVELVVGELTKGAAAADQPTQMVTITTGLAAEGYVEVKAAEPTLQEGDLVVVGLAAASQPTQTATPDS